MSMGQNLSQRAEISLAQRLQLRLGMIHELGDDMEGLLDQSGFAPEATYDVMVNQLVERVAVRKLIPPLAEGETTEQRQQSVIEDASLLSHILKDDNTVNLREYALGAPLTMADLQPDVNGQPTMRINRMTEIVVRRLFAHLGGPAGVQLPDDTEIYRTLAPHLVTAFTEPTLLQRQIDEASKIASSSDAGVGAMQEVNERQYAIRLAAKLKDDVEWLRARLELAYSIPDEQRQPLFRNFFRDLALLKRLMFLESSRLQRRFVADFGRVSGRTRPKEKELAMVNLIGDYTLVSVGAIVPEVFIRRSNVVDEVAASYAREEVCDAGGDLTQLLQKYKLQDSGRYFWHAYGAKEVGTNRATDQALREFVTETVRAQRECLLAAIDYPTLFKNVQDANLARKDYDEEQTEGMEDDELRAIFVRALRRDEFRAEILKLVRQDWYGQLRQFMTDRGSTR